MVLPEARGGLYYFEHKLPESQSHLTRRGKTHIYVLEFQDGTFPNGLYSYVSYVRPQRKQPRVATMRNEQGQLVKIPWVYGNVKLVRRYSAKCNQEQKRLEITLHKETAQAISPSALLSALEIQLGKTESLFKLLGMDELLQKIGNYEVVFN